MRMSSGEFAQSPTTRPSPWRRVGRAVGRTVGYLRTLGVRYALGAIGAALCVILLLLPSGFVTEGPGPTRDVLGTVDDDGSKSMIEISGAKTYRDSGKLLLTTVNSYGTREPAINAQVLWAWLNPKAGVLPREAVIPPGQTTESYLEKTRKQMTGAQDSAASHALAYLAKHDEGQGDVSKAKVTMHIDDIGGPSAGLMYTLGVIDRLTPVDESGGRTIAGTGTMEKDGSVGEIGGIRLKMIGAKRDGATWFLAPAGNCDEVVGNVPSGLRDVRVTNLDDAYRALKAIGQGKGDSLPHCTVKVTR
ncbi:YlbL family protein [Bifidobacterium simiarum]